MTVDEVQKRLAANLKSVRADLDVCQDEMAALMGISKRQLQNLEGATTDLTLLQLHLLTQNSSVKVVHALKNIPFAVDPTGQLAEVAEALHRMIDNADEKEIAFILEYWDDLTEHQVIVGSDIHNVQFVVYE